MGAGICSSVGCLIDYGTERCTRCQNVVCRPHQTQHRQRCGNQRHYYWMLALFFVSIVVLSLSFYVFTSPSSTKRKMKIKETPPENDAVLEPVSCTSTNQCPGQQLIFENSSLLTSESQNQLNSFYESQTSHLAKWQLIYRGSIHGVNATAFHTRCDKKGETFTVLSSTRGYLFGGYTDANWNTSLGDLPTYARSEKTFLFSLVSPQNLPARKFPLNTRYAEYSIVNDFLSGPIFGGMMRPDIGIHESNGQFRCQVHFPSLYMSGVGISSLPPSDGCIIDEIEVFIPVFKTSTSVSFGIFDELVSLIVPLIRGFCLIVVAVVITETS